MVQETLPFRVTKRRPEFNDAESTAKRARAAPDISPDVRQLAARNTHLQMEVRWLQERVTSLQTEAQATKRELKRQTQRASAQENIATAYQGMYSKLTRTCASMRVEIDNLRDYLWDADPVSYVPAMPPNDVLALD